MAASVIAHRGASGTRPENTLLAFRRAAELGAPMVELDAQLTRDGEVVVIHDFTLDRTTDGTGAVRDRTLAEIRRLDAGRWFDPGFAGERVPTLAEVLAAVPLGVNVELKPVGEDGLEARALEVVESAGALARVVFSSFDLGILERLRARSRSAAIGLLWEDDTITQALQCANRVAATALHLRKDALHDATIATVAAAGLRVRVWTVNDQAEMEALVAAGVDAVFTDYPERFLQIHPRQ